MFWKWLENLTKKKYSSKFWKVNTRASLFNVPALLNKQTKYDNCFLIGSDQHFGTPPSHPHLLFSWVYELFRQRTFLYLKSASVCQCTPPCGQSFSHSLCCWSTPARCSRSPSLPANSSYSAPAPCNCGSSGAPSPATMWSGGRERQEQCMAPSVEKARQTGHSTFHISSAISFSNFWCLSCWVCHQIDLLSG